MAAPRKPITSGASAAVNKGNVAIIRMRIVMTCVKLCKNVLYESDTLLSVRSTSLENLLMIRPSGVVSKKDIGARTIRSRACQKVSRVTGKTYPIVQLLCSLITTDCQSKTKEEDKYALD